MQKRLISALCLAALCATLACVATGNAAQLDGQVITVALASPATNLDADVAQEPPADALFADAPYGVDPVVTGPVSAAFNQKRIALRCDDAVWPNVPAACYPD